MPVNRLKAALALLCPYLGGWLAIFISWYRCPLPFPGVLVACCYIGAFILYMVAVISNLCFNGSLCQIHDKLFKELTFKQTVNRNILISILSIAVLAGDSFIRCPSDSPLPYIFVFVSVGLITNAFAYIVARF